VQAATGARATKFIGVGRAEAEVSLWEKRSASKYCEHDLRVSGVSKCALERTFWAGICILSATAAASKVVIIV
jgi:hypothetical protein